VNTDLTPHEVCQAGMSVAYRDEADAARDLELLFNVVPHVMHEKVVSLKAPAPDHWSLAPDTRRFA